MRALRRSHRVTDVLCAPGNAGIAADAECLPDVAADDAAAIVAAAKEHRVDLAAIGPEAGLVAGAVDALEAAGIPAFGPTRAAAELEGSKAFAKQLMEEAGVPTAAHVLLHGREEALERLACTSYPTVLKAAGLAAGKGVIICQSEEEARGTVDVFFTERRFGSTTVVLEDFLEGEELSLLAICDGENVVPLAPAQDYKRIFDGDEGPNTGGMGSYSPVPGFGTAEVDEIVERVHRPVVATMAARGVPFHGVLYAGLMIGPEGPKVLEFNARFGDPETQAVLPRMRSDLPDAPLTRFVMVLRGGRHGLLENSANLCTAPPFATVRAIGQNNRGAAFSSQLRGERCRKQRRGGSGKGGKNKGGKAGKRVVR